MSIVPSISPPYINRNWNSQLLPIVKDRFKRTALQFNSTLFIKLQISIN